MAKNCVKDYGKLNIKNSTWKTQTHNKIIHVHIQNNLILGNLRVKNYYPFLWLINVDNFGRFTNLLRSKTIA